VARVGDEAAHGVELVIAREDQVALAGLPALVVLLVNHLDEVLNQVEHAVPGPDPLPQVSRRKTLPGRRVSGTAVTPLVEGEEPGLGSLQVGSHINEIRIDREVRQATAEGEKRFTGVAVDPVLVDGVLHGLSHERIFQLRRWASR
jgi:hypothetical protein